MFQFGDYDEPRHYGSVPWLHDNSATKHNAKTNKYLHTTSSIFDDPKLRDSIRQERGRQALDDLKQQVEEREAAKRREREEEERIFAAMNAPTTYNPSFHEPEARKRSQGQRANPGVDTSDMVQNTGGGYYGGGYDDGGGGYGGEYGAGGYDDPYAGYGTPESDPSYTTPKFYGGRKPQRFNANMTSDERAMVNRDRAAQVQGELQWQIQMRKQLEAERKRKEELEEKLMEESIKKQQQKMKNEYEAEMEKKRRREEEQTRRREAQLRHIEMIQNQVQSEKTAKVARARAAADEAASAVPSDSRHDRREIKQTKTPPEQPPAVKMPPKEEAKPEPTKKRMPKMDDDFGLNLKSDSRFLAARQPNKFFDSPNTPIKMPRTEEDRKRPKPMPEDSFSAPRPNFRPKKTNRPKTTLGVAPRDVEEPSPSSLPPQPPVILEPEITSDSQTDTQYDTQPDQSLVPPRTADSEVQTERPERVNAKVQTTLALDKWESERKREEPRPTTYVRGTPFDWRIKIDGLTDEDQRKLNEKSEEDIKQFEENNGDLLSQLSALKTNLGPKTGNDDTWNPGGQPSASGKGQNQRNGSRGSSNSGYEPSSRQDTTRNSRSTNQPTNSRGTSGNQPQDPYQQDQTTSPAGRTQSGDQFSSDQYDPDQPTVPAGRLEDVDYMRIPTGGLPDSLPNTPTTAEAEALAREYGINPDDTSGTTLRKFLEKTNQRNKR